MHRKNRRCLMKIFSIILAFSLCAPVGAQAAKQETAMPQSSDYLADYYAHIRAVGGGDLEIWFEINANDFYADIGALSIQLYESTDSTNFYWVKTFRFSEYENMLWHDNFYCSDHVDYEGVPGRYYKADVRVRVSFGTGNDTRDVWTSVKRCV